ncbi:response regulator transcription factor [Arcobacter sp. FWKO B]|uniref:response regulator transcription factor n=1 Tax=Arcobacter sp. FWKO B TaxID=2593672 RepID=UPI001908EECD|nr:response regulator transcription factor [Arcobacter sp. FWKO B]
MKIFLIEDDIYLNTLICDVLQTQGYEVVTFADGAKAVSALDERSDLYIIDLSLPNISGFDILKKINSLGKNTAVIIISAEDNIDTILQAYNLGCQDYIKKPFDVKELLAKVSLIEKKQPKTKVKLSDNCYYDISKKMLYVNNMVVQLTQKENLLLHLLVLNIGDTVTKEEAEKYIWGEYIDNGYVRQLISKLRKKLGCAKILNHSGNGYRLEINA